MQLSAILAKVPPGLPYWKWAKMQENVTQEILEQPYPHRYLILWIECENRRDQTSGVRPYPRSGSYEEQDAEMTLAFEILDEYREKQRHEEEIMKRAQDAASANRYMN